MRVSILFEHFKENISLPLHYNYLLQSFTYHHISKNMADFLHNEGYKFGKRKFKLFTFSRLMGRFRINKEKITFSGPIHFHISSPIEGFIQEFAETLARVPQINLSENPLIVSSIEVHFKPNISDSVNIKMLSPLTIYSTLSLADGRKKTYYYSPFEKEFSSLTAKNIFKKYNALYKKEPFSSNFSIEPLKINKQSEKIIKYKGTVIKAWMGTYSLKGNPELISLAYDAGLGSKNPQGFGMFEILR